MVDLPPVKTVDSVWSASAPVAVGKQNPSATMCDDASFTGKSVVSAQSRVFAIPESKVLPDQFALTQTVGRFTSDKAAEKFYETIIKRVEACPDSDLPAKIDEEKKISGPDFTGRSWRIGLGDRQGQGRLLPHGHRPPRRDVTQVLFPPAGKYAISGGEFRSVLQPRRRAPRLRAAVTASVYHGPVGNRAPGEVSLGRRQFPWTVVNRRAGTTKPPRP